MHVVIFTGGEAPQPQRTSFYLSSAPAIDYVIAADSGLDTLAAYEHFYNGTYSFKPDYIVGDMDSIKDRSLLEKYSKAKMDIFNTDKDWTDTELALQKARQVAGNRKKDLITLIGGDGGRTDHLLSIFDTFTTDFHCDMWLCKEQAICFLGAGETVSVTNVNTDDRISVARTPSSYDKGSVETEGLEWEGSVFRKKGMPSVSNRIKKEYFALRKKILFKASESDFFVMVPLHAMIKYENR